MGIDRHKWKVVPTEIGDDGRAEAGGHGVLSPPSGAVGGDQDAGVQGGEVVEHDVTSGRRVRSPPRSEVS
jgi:hypothetical protein